MIHLLKIEWLKVKNYKTFWIFTVLYFVSILGINYTGYYINELAIKSMPEVRLYLEALMVSQRFGKLLAG